ncbi:MULTISPECIES: DUF3093 domain-containing protein [unclassified Rathayibacter]|jgi:hypothetical protein|uniref:DUF3093 domain-containing protein n=1 Tax=unclassified Rathayibacter TaxID=2609250 RepID=UPI000CE7F36D|nr:MULTISPECIES: DUF3093 domain-containing protein [unclassified Rathayibacter]PPG53772.1 DUF3093 domain-containing protein [Rathayibacter sp. AY2B3]PPI25018.1 DUF3093 domain-containing protein [Rathayibacter sp. AY1B6]PPI28316.1 DUF3093 domain-containing protein [Rathayibacter sp. AY1B5]PPI39356.1 DUF3093 domain-containing protein [Rathayibacter sp. AY1B1]QHC70366.1 DUF3093 family protein [Rathayibacter sp. VKM Ac-2801]
MPSYRERLWPAPWLFVATALVIPASILVFAPIDFAVGVIVAVVLYAGCVLSLLALSPVIEVAEGELRAGRAHIPLDLVGEPSSYTGDQAFAERGTRLDARAYLVIRGWVKDVVRVPIEDPADPTPYWLVSTRRPDDIVAAIRGSRRRSGRPSGPGGA